jgi:hypothetical protein
MILAMVIGSIVDEILHTELHWGGTIALVGTGIPSVIIGLSWMLTPQDLVDLQKKIWWRRIGFRLSAWEARVVGWVVMLFGVLCTALGILLTLEYIRISVF